MAYDMILLVTRVDEDSLFFTLHVSVPAALLIGAFLSDYQVCAFVLWVGG